jgi:murein DD-endopeptidase MepM/ murein hydrolase activator NlpD
VYDLPRSNRSPGGLTVRSCPQCPLHPQPSALSLGSRPQRGDAVGVLRNLVATVLIAVTCGVSLGLSHLARWPDHAVPTTTLTAVVHRAADINDELGRRYGWPLRGSPTVVRAFHPPTVWYGPGHRGVDLASTAGAAVLAAGAGTVIYAGIVAGRGVVSVDHPGGLRTTYEPVSSTVTAGERVVRGQQIGTVQPGHLGCPVTVCLHWGVLRRPPEGAAPVTEQDRQYLDPLRLLAGTRVRLLPIDDQRTEDRGDNAAVATTASASGRVQ